MGRCRREIAAIEAELIAGNPDIRGLVLGLSDWWAELRILEEEKTPPGASPAARKRHFDDRPTT